MNKADNNTPTTAKEWGSEALKYGLIMIGLGIAVAIGIVMADKGMK